MPRHLKNSLIMLALCSVVANAQTPVVAEGAQVEKLADSFKFTEGPAADASGNVYFTDQPNDRIMVWTVEGALTTFMEGRGRANGLCFDSEGYLWACADAKNELWRISPTKDAEVIVRNFEGKLLNAPNDLWLTPKGGIYFTDPWYKRDYWDRDSMDQPCEGVYYVAPGDRKVTRVVDDLKVPNGIIGTPDGKTLYVSDLEDNTTWKYSIADDGTLSGKTLFCALGSDGMTIDTAGNVYLTGNGVTVFDATGTQIEHIAIDEPWTANVCFGGKDRDYLFITASTALYRVLTRVKGAGSQ